MWWKCSEAESTLQVNDLLSELHIINWHSVLFRLTAGAHEMLPVCCVSAFKSFSCLWEFHRKQNPLASNPLAYIKPVTHIEINSILHINNFLPSPPFSLTPIFNLHMDLCYSIQQPPSSNTYLLNPLIKFHFVTSFILHLNDTINFWIRSSLFLSPLLLEGA